jgi:hypothetical protein
MACKYKQYCIDSTNMMTYLIGTTITFGVLLNAFLKDQSTAKNDVLSWFILLIGASLWFVAVPFIIRKKVFGARTASPAIASSL